jgi:hypothetical protein
VLSITAASVAYGVEKRTLPLADGINGSPMKASGSDGSSGSSGGTG